MPRLQTTRWRDVSAGIVQKVSPDIAIPNSVPFSMNLDFSDELGIAVTRLGTAIVGSQLSDGNPCLGLHNFRDADASNHGLLAAFNGVIYNTETGASLASSLSSSAKWHFITFLDSILALNGTNSALGGTSAVSALSTSGGNLGVSGVPSGANFPIEWHDRVYAAVRDRLYYTSTPSSGTVSWSASGSGSIQIEQEDGGGNITGTAKVPGYLLIFKQRSLKRWNFDSTYPDDLVSLGTQSQGSVVMARGRCFFFYGPKGFYQTTGGYPERISRPVQRFIDAIPSSYYASVTGGSDEEHVYWSIGDITIDLGRGYTETHNNVVLRYTIDTQAWTAYKYPQELRFFSRFIDDTAVTLVAGDDDGNVVKLNSGTTDYSSQAITYILQSDELVFGDRSENKTISDKITVHSYNAAGAILEVQIDYGTWDQIGTVDNFVTDIQIPNLRGKVFSFRLTNSVTGAQVKLIGLDFQNVFLEES